MLKNRKTTGLSMVFAVHAAALTSMAHGQTAPATKVPATPAPASAAPSPSALPTSLEALGWLRGCWLGNVNRREFLEQWSPPRGGMMVGFSHTTVAPREKGSLKDQIEATGKATNDPNKDRTQDFEYLRLEARGDGIYYVAVPSGKKEVTFKLNEVSDDSGAKLFTFTNLGDGFPQRLVYRHGTGGWLYAQVMGKPGSSESEVVYPMRHVDCATDTLLKE